MEVELEARIIETNTHIANGENKHIKIKGSGGQRTWTLPYQKIAKSEPIPLQKKEQLKQLNSLLKMYQACLLKQSNYARMFAGTSQATPLPGAGGLYTKHPDPAGYRNAFNSLEPICDGYRKEWDTLYQQIYKPK